MSNTIVYLVLMLQDGPVELAKAGRGQYIGQPAIAARGGKVTVLWEMHEFSLPVPVGNVRRWVARRTSKDGGKAFAPADAAVRYHVTDAMYPSLAYDDKGDLLLSYALFKLSVTQHYEDPRVNLLRSDDSGESFGASSTIHRPPAGRPPSFPRIAAGKEWHLAVTLAGEKIETVTFRSGKSVRSVPGALRAFILAPDERPVLAAQDGNRGLLFVGDEKAVEFASDLDESSQVALAVHKGKVHVLWTAGRKLWLLEDRTKEIALGEWSRPSQIAMIAARDLHLFFYAVSKRQRHLVRIQGGGAPEIVSKEPIVMDSSIDDRRGLVQCALDGTRVIVAWTDGRKLWFARPERWY